jgi:CheY-like chemotaxis protein
MVDDSEDDVFFVQRAFEKTGLGDGFESVSNGGEAIAYLCGDGKYSDRKEYPFPKLILLDLKMPGVDGFGVLEWLRGHEVCKIVPTVVFSSSAIEEDVKRAYVLGANAYMTKPSSLPEMLEVVRVTEQFWSRCEMVRMPVGEKCA